MADRGSYRNRAIYLRILCAFGFRRKRISMLFQCLIEMLEIRGVRAVRETDSRPPLSERNFRLFGTRKREEFLFNNAFA